MRYYEMISRMAKFYKDERSSIGEDVEKLKFSYAAYRNVKW